MRGEFYEKWQGGDINVQINILTLILHSLFIWEQDWLKREFQIEVLNLIPKRMENRLVPQISC